MAFTRDGITFHSELEYNRYQHFIKNRVQFEYHLKVPIEVNIGRRKTYTPDFIILDGSTAIIEETKGYDMWNGNDDNKIMIFMQTMVKNSPEFLKKWLYSNGIKGIKEVEYRRIKFLKAHGWVDFSFKSPKAIDECRKSRDEARDEIKELKRELKEYSRYLSYVFSEKKLTKKQIVWMEDFKRRFYEN